MTDHDHIVEKIEFQSKLIEDQAERLKNIEKLLSGLAVQEERITNMQSKINALWKKYDEAFKPEGTIAKLQRASDKCPVDSLKISINRLWAALGISFSVIVGLLAYLK